jgi:hypothetical protein
MNKICTTIEQSKKLIELGIDVNTADMMLDDWNLIGEGWEISVGYHPEIEQDYGRKCYPSWSLAALLKLMPFQIIENNRFGFYQVKGFNKQGDTYRFGYKTNNDSFLFETSWHNDVVDAAFEMVCWLKENNKI